MAQNSKINLNEKVGFVIFGFLGILFLILGFFNIKSRLKAPFALQKNGQAITIEEQNQEILKTKDSDADGLTDYDETLLYNTSPYIADSDSDGLSDSDEIKQNSNPNCPKGKTCEVEAMTAPPPVLGAPETGSMDLNKTLSELESGGAPTASALREALLQAGVDKSLLEKMSDAELLKLYEETAKEQQ